MAHYSRDEQNDNHSRQQPNRPDNDVVREGQVNSAYGDDRSYRLSAWLRFVKRSLAFVFFRINEIRNLINTCADH